MSKILSSIDSIFEYLEKNIVGFATIIMAILVFVNVVLRNTVDNSFPWVNEVCSYLNIFAVFMAISAGFKYGTHVGVSVVVDYVIPKRLRKATGILTEIIVLAFCLLVAYQAVRMSSAQFESGQVSAVLKIPLWIIYASAAFGMILSSIRVIMKIIEKISNKEKSGGDSIC